MERLLYLDCDMMVFEDVSPLWSLDLQGKAAAAVIEPARELLGFHPELAGIATRVGSTFSDDDHYFNAGFWMINVPEWRKYRVRESARELFGGHFKLGRFHDQSALNIILRKKILPISSCWNLIEPLYLWESSMESFYRDYGRNSPHSQPKIRHFAGQPKPDGLWVRGSEERLFYHHLAQTEWKDTVSEVSKKWWKPYLGELLDFHYLMIRGVKQKALPGYRKDLKVMLYRSPYLPLLYLGILGGRMLRKVMNLIKRFKIRFQDSFTTLF